LYLSKKINELQKVGIIEESFLNKLNEDASYLNSSLEYDLFAKIIKKFNDPKVEDILIEEFNKNDLKEAFLKIAMYVFNSDREGLKNFKFIALNKEGYVVGEFLEDIYILLASPICSKMYIEILGERGLFKDYNKDKKIPETLEFNGRLLPIFDCKEAVFERVFVETPLDTDRDGKRDLIAVYIKRPKETNKGLKVPSIYMANPYMMGSDDDLYVLHSVDKNLKKFEETNISFDDIKFSESDKKFEIPPKRQVRGFSVAKKAEPYPFDCVPEWYNYFLSRGYAIVLAGGIGTRYSEGIRTCGSEEETISTISVIDWLNDRQNGFTNKKDCIKVQANWSSGFVGMNGKSYVGTLAIAALMSGVEGLKTIVPEASISNWYEYYRSDGLVLPALGWQGDDADLLALYCMSRMNDLDDYKNVKEMFEKSLEEMKLAEDRDSGNYNKFWDERNYLRNASNMKASVFIVHGLKDWNVKTKQFDLLWNELEKYDIPRKMLLHQGDHIDISNLKGSDYLDIMNRWYGHWLYDIDNNIMDEIPNVMIQSNINASKWKESKKWPFEEVKETFYYSNSSNCLSNEKNVFNKEECFLDDINKMGFDREKENKDKWIRCLVDNPISKNVFRNAYICKEEEKNRRISGSVKLSFSAKADSEVGIISAMLVDYGIETRLDLERISTKEKIKFGINAGECDIVKFKEEEKQSEYEIITRGWLNMQNRRNNYNKDLVVKDKYYSYKLEMQPMDYTIKKGHRIGLIIYGTDVEATQRQLKTTKITIENSSIELMIPIK